MRSCFPRIFSWLSMTGILLLAHSYGSLDSIIGQVWLGNSLFSGWDFLRVVSTAVWDSACLILLLISLYRYQYSVAVWRLSLLTPASSLHSLLVFFQQLSWKADPILVSASQMTWPNRMTLNVTIRNCFEDGEHGISISTDNRSGRNWLRIMSEVTSRSVFKCRVI